MLVDFHTHTDASDGALKPRELLDRAHLLGLNQLAITDHDTLDGWRSVRHHWEEFGSNLKLRTGIELSSEWQGNSIHVLGIDVDPENPCLILLEDQQRMARYERATKISNRLSKVGIKGALAGATRLAGGAALSRPHFAKWLCFEGYVSDEAKAFKRYLGRGKIGDINALWPSLETTVSVICGAKGLAVLAHPLKYNFTNAKLERLIAYFRECGGNALEIISGRQNLEQIHRLRRLTCKFSLLASVGSDFHRDSEYSANIGINAADLGQIPNIWSDASKF